MRNIEFEVIENDNYSAEINEILNEEEMESLVQIKYIKYPNLFESLKQDSFQEKNPLILIGIDRNKNKLVGVGACTIFENNIAYLSSFRIKKEYRSRVKFSDAYKKLIERSREKGIELIITTILEENELAKKILTKNRKNMPIYEFYKNINFYSIKNKNKAQLILEDENSYEYKNLKLSLKKKKNKKYIAVDYKKIYYFFYKIRKILSFFGYPELVKIGAEYNFIYLDISPKENDFKECQEAIKFIQNKGYNSDFFLVGAYENSLLDNELKKMKAFKYSSKLYKVYYEDYKPNFEKEIDFKFWNL